MRWLNIVLGGSVAIASTVFGCQSDDTSSCSGATPDADAGADAGDADEGNTDAGDARCETKAVLLTTHPWAVKQASSMGRSLRNVRAFHGSLYFGYGDLDGNTGPIEIASYDPASKKWTDHLTLQTESIERYVAIGDELWAPCADVHGSNEGGCQYASGDANQKWTVHNFTVSLHMMDAVERVPGDVLLAGSSFLDSTQTTTGAFIWESVGGAPFQQIFPDGKGDIETGGGPFMSLATLHNVAYAVTGGSVWTWDGTTWLHARSPGDIVDPVLLGDFIHPVTLADQIVFGGFGGYLFRFDGKHTTPLGIRSYQTPTDSGFTEAPIVIFESTEDRLLVVDEAGDLLMSTDVTHFTCIGKAPKDVRGVGSMGGVVYFGGANGRVYAYEHPSW